MNHSLNRACALIAAIFVHGIVSSSALGVNEPTSLVFKIPDIVIQSSSAHSTLGMFHVSLDLTGDYAANPPTIASYNVAFELADAHPGVMLGSPQDMVENKLFAAGSTFAGATELPHTIRFAKDALAPVAAIDGGVMVSVPFMVSAGVTGTFPLQFVPGNELTNPIANALPIVLVDGSITVQSATSLVAGDYNADGSVDAADYVVWRTTVGQSGTGLAADGNGDGEIDHVDYELWRAGFGRSSPDAATAAAVVPEPATFLSIVVLGVILLAVRLCR
jgi:hypothetical protein